MTTYFFLFLISFFAATIFPFSSELTLVGLLKTENYSPLLLVSSASLGNILGSVFNWFLGHYLLKHLNKKWFPFKKNEIDRASSWFKKFGIWTLFFSWVPIVGDPLTFVAGMLRIKFSIFLILVSTGKILRYLMLSTLF